MSIGKEEPIKDELGGAKYMLVRAENLRRKPNIERYHDMIRFSSERLYKEMNGKEPNYPYEYAEAFDNFFEDPLSNRDEIYEQVVNENYKKLGGYKREYAMKMTEWNDWLYVPNPFWRPGDGMKKAYYAIKKNLDYDTEEEMDRMMEDLEEHVKKAEEEEKNKKLSISPMSSASSISDSELIDDDTSLESESSLSLISDSDSSARSNNTESSLDIAFGELSLGSSPKKSRSRSRSRSRSKSRSPGKKTLKSIKRTGKRCPKGYRYNKKTGECDPVSKTRGRKKSPSKKKTRKHSPQGAKK